MLIVSSDPGLTGAISLLCSQRGLLECEDLPICGNGTASGKMMRWIDVDGLQRILTEWAHKYEFAQHSVRAAIERPIPMPTLPAQTVASQFDTFGVIRALVGNKVGPGGLHIVTPNEWKKTFGLKSDKDASIACALRLYPSAANLLKFKKSHNRAESILVGHFLLRQIA